MQLAMADKMSSSNSNRDREAKLPSGMLRALQGTLGKPQIADFGIYS